MKCCVECFYDKEIRDRIKGLKQVGNCNICEAENVFIYDTEIDYILVDDFVALLDTYKPESMLPTTGYPADRLVLLKNELYNNWNIFNLEPEKIDILIKNICHTKYKEEPELFEEKIGIIELYDKNFLEEYSLLGEHDWEEFVRSIKMNNRFHSNHFNTKVFFEFLDFLKSSYKRDKTFYRARICDGNALSKEELSAPPQKLATAGRVNPEGISYLYLSSDKKTTLSEIRAGLHDYVSLATFKLKEDISVVDLTGINNISAFSGLNFTQHAINKHHLKMINNEIAKPLRRHDSHLDYLPTQYICEYIKTINFKDGTDCSGIKYKSTMNKEGYNLAIFNDDLFECTDITVYDVLELQYVVNPAFEELHKS